jgi:dihydrofolate reductase
VIARRVDIDDAPKPLNCRTPGRLTCLSSPNLVQHLIKENVVDELRVIIDLVNVGGGKLIFPEDGALRTKRLVGSDVTSTNGFIATYAIA